MLSGVKKIPRPGLFMVFVDFVQEKTVFHGFSWFLQANDYLQKKRELKDEKKRNRKRWKIYVNAYLCLYMHIK